MFYVFVARELMVLRGTIKSWHRVGTNRFFGISIALTHDLIHGTFHDGLTWEKSFEKEKVQFSHMNMVPFLKNIDLATSG